MNIVKAIKLAKKRKMGFVRKNSYDHKKRGLFISNKRNDLQNRGLSSRTK